MLDQSDLCTELAGSSCAAEASWASSDNQQIESSARCHLLVKIFVSLGPETYSKGTVGNFRFIANFAPPLSARRSSLQLPMQCACVTIVPSGSSRERCRHGTGRSVACLPLIMYHRMHSKTVYFDHSHNHEDQERRRKSGTGAEKQV